MTLGFIFNHFFAKTYFGAFSVFHTKYVVILEDKKSKHKNTASEKNLTQEVRSIERFFIVNFILLW